MCVCGMGEKQAQNVKIPNVIVIVCMCVCVILYFCFSLKLMNRSVPDSFASFRHRFGSVFRFFGFSVDSNRSIDDTCSTINEYAYYRKLHYDSGNMNKST